MNKTTKTATGGAGIPYGHVPGHQFHDVDCELRQRGARWVCILTETWGSAQGQGRDEVHGRNVYRGAGETPDDACRDARGQMRAGDPGDPAAASYASTACAEALAQIDDAEDAPEAP